MIYSLQKKMKNEQPGLKHNILLKL